MWLCTGRAAWGASWRAQLSLKSVYSFASVLLCQLDPFCVRWPCGWGEKCIFTISISASNVSSVLSVLPMPSTLLCVCTMALGMGKGWAVIKNAIYFSNKVYTCAIQIMRCPSVCFKNIRDLEICKKAKALGPFRAVLLPLLRQLLSALQAVLNCFLLMWWLLPESPGSWQLHRAVAVLPAQQ